MSASISIREMKVRRERAVDWITWASWTAMASAVWALLMVLLIVIGERPPSRADYPLLIGVVSSAAGQASVGWYLGKSRSQWNAWALMTLYAFGLVVSVLRDGLWHNILFRVAVAVVYVLGFMGTVEYAEMDKAIHQAAQQPPEPTGEPHAG